VTDTSPEIRAVVVERELRHPPERVWRALTQQPLIEEWLLPNDFSAVVGHRFRLSGDWGAVDGEVLEVTPHRSLSYTWGDHDLASVVTWTLTPTAAGTHLRMEQSGFRADQPRYYGGARAGWPKFLANLEQLLERMD
jgi:uncharacterized protein YndB with AHSA1/START domain